MDIVSLSLGILAIFIAGASFVYTVRTSRREETHRRDEIGLLRRQVEGEEAARDAESQARLDAFALASNGGERMDSYTFRVTNAGPAIAQDITAMAVDENGDAVASAEWPHLRPGQEFPVILEVPRDRSRQRGLSFEVTWRDTEEHRRRFSDLQPPSTLP